MNKYQFMPDLDDSDFQALKASIKQDGQIHHAVEVDENGDILDGHFRVKAWKELMSEGVDLPEYPVITKEGMTEDEKRMYAITVNVARRHLSTNQKKEYVMKIKELSPDKSTREIAKETGMHHSTIGRILKNNSGVANATDTPPSHGELVADGAVSKKRSGKAAFDKLKKSAREAAQNLGHNILEMNTVAPNEEAHGFCTQCSDKIVVHVSTDTIQGRGVERQCKPKKWDAPPKDLPESHERPINLFNRFLDEQFSRMDINSSLAIDHSSIQCFADKEKCPLTLSIKRVNDESRRGKEGSIWIRSHIQGNKIFVVARVNSNELVSLNIDTMEG